MIVWHKHNLMVSSSVTMVKYSYKIPREYLSAWGNLSRIRDFFFNCSIGLPYVVTFLKQFYF